MKGNDMNEKVLPLEFLNNVETMLFISDAETSKILFMNKKMREEFDLDGKVLGENCFQIFKDNVHYNGVISSDDNLEKQIWEEHNTKTNKYYRNTGSFIKLFDDKTYHLREVTDITKEVFLKNELKETKEKMDALDSSNSNFYNRMKENIKIPVNNIKGLSEIASSTIDIRKIKKCLEKIKTENTRLSNYLDGVFDMSKIDANKLEFVKEPFSFENMLMGVSNSVKEKCRQKNQMFQIKMDMEMPAYFLGDEHRISQVLESLLNNSVNNTGEGGKIQIDICQVSLVHGASTVEVSVSDSGFGMNPEIEKEVRNLFEETDQNKITNCRNLGLGLPISKSIIMGMGGKLNLYSSTSFGTTISFTLKLEIFENRFFDRKLLPGLNIQNLSVLILDNSFEVCEYARKILKGFNIDCDTTTTHLGFQNKMETAFYDNRHYNIIFIEENIKDMNSVKIVQMIKKNFPKTKIVILQDKENSANKETFLNLEVKHFMEKPIFPSQLVDAVNEIVSVPYKGQSNYRNKKFDFYNKNILIVEDMELNREILKKILKETKISIDCAENGIVALEMFKENKNKYDLILMDVNMPELDGIETAKEMRMVSNGRQASATPIIGITANNSEQEIRRCKSAGMNDHISKPIDEDYLLEILAKHLPKHVSEEREEYADREFLDIDEALERVRGNTKVYKALLNNFLKENKFEELKAAVFDNEYEKAYKLAHQIKGAVANLSLTKVYNIMNIIERELFDGNDTSHYIKEADAIFKDTLACIENYLYEIKD